MLKHHFEKRIFFLVTYISLFLKTVVHGCEYVNDLTCSAHVIMRLFSLCKTTLLFVIKQEIVLPHRSLTRYCIWHFHCICQNYLTRCSIGHFHYILRVVCFQGKSRIEFVFQLCLIVTLFNFLIDPGYIHWPKKIFSL